MTNDFLEAAKNSDSKDSSEERYKKLKEEQAGNDMSQAEQRYQELKEEAKREFVEKQKQKAEDDDDSEDSEEVEEDDGGFITH